MVIYAERDGNRRGRWPIGNSEARPSNAMIQRAGIDPQSVLKIEAHHEHGDRHYWLVILPKTKGA